MLLPYQRRELDTLLSEFNEVRKRVIDYLEGILKEWANEEEASEEKDLDLKYERRERIDILCDWIKALEEKEGYVEDLDVYNG